MLKWEPCMGGAIAKKDDGATYMVIGTDIWRTRFFEPGHFHALNDPGLMLYTGSLIECLQAAERHAEGKE